MMIAPPPQGRAAATFHLRAWSIPGAVTRDSDRLLAVACTMLTAGTPFDPAHPSKLIDGNAVTPC